MATTGAYTAGIHSFTSQMNVEPNFSNDYLVDFIDWSGVTTGGANLSPWINPLGKTTHLIQPFIPGDCGQLTELFKECINHEHLSSIFCLPAFCESLVVIDLNDLMNLSLVSKCCYIATKSNLLWQGKVNFLLSNVYCMPQSKCSFAPEQQFQIVFKELQNRKAPFQLQYKHDMEKIDRLVKEQYTTTRSWTVFLQQWVNPVEDDNIKKEAFRVLFCNRLGENYDGTPESISPTCNPGRCLAALKLIPNEFNNQAAFELLITAASQAAANVIPTPSDDFAIEEVSDDDVIGPNDDYYFSIISNHFDLVSIPSSDPVQVALSAFKNIQSSVFKMKAFAFILSNRQLPCSIAKSFYDALPLALQNAFKGEMYAVNGYSSVYNGHDHGVGFGDFMVAHQIRSDVAREAAFSLYISLSREGS